MMRSLRELDKIILRVYRQMFRESIPSLDFDEMYARVKAGKLKLKPNWFMKYYLPMERQEKIIKMQCRRSSLNKAEMDYISVNVHLGCSPRSVLAVRGKALKELD
jgi:hypothetical protein